MHDPDDGSASASVTCQTDTEDRSYTRAAVEIAVHVASLSCFASELRFARHIPEHDEEVGDF
jgi:hypothetical protein